MFITRSCDGSVMTFSLAHAERKRAVALGAACYNAGRHGSALEHFRRALALGEKNPQVRCYTAHAYYCVGKPRQAIVEFSRIIKEFPRYLPGYLGQASIFSFQGRLEEADRILRRAFLLKPRDKAVRSRLAEILREQARIYQREGKFILAEKALAGSLKFDPHSIAARMRLSEIMPRRGKPDKTRSLLIAAARQRPGAGSEGSDRFRILMRLRRYPQAFKAADRILEEGPAVGDLRAFWNPWGWVPGLLKDLHGSEFEILNRLDPKHRDNPWFHYYRGCLNKGGEALVDFRRIAQFPRKKYGWMFSKVGWASLRLGFFSEAIDEFSVALRYKTVDWTTHGYLAEAYLCRGQTQAAFSEMDRAMSVAPADEKGQVLAWQGEFDLWLGNYRRALRRLEEACGRGAQHAYCWKGAALLKLGRKTEALECLNKALKLYPQDVEAVIWRAETHRELGRHEQALKDLNGKSTGLWFLFNRALSRGGINDFSGMKSDFEAIPQFVTDHIKNKIRIKSASQLSFGGMKKILFAGIKLARGYRRDDYGQAMWIG